MPSRVNTSSISASGTTASAFSVALGVVCAAGDLIIVTADCNGTHATNGMSCTEPNHSQTFTTILETQQGGASSRWIQTFYLLTTVALSATDTIQLTPYAANTQSTFVVDIFRGATGTISRAAVGTSGATGLTATNPALATAPPAGDLVLSLTGVSSGTATQPSPFVLGSQVTTGPTTTNAYVLSADGTSTYGGTWTWGTSNSSSLQTVAFGQATGVNFDAVGPSAVGASASASTSLTWTHTGLGSGLAVVAGGGCSVSGVTSSMTIGGTSATSLGKIDTGTGGGGFTQAFGLANVATGAQSCVWTVSSSSDLTAGSTSFTGAGATVGTAFGTAATHANNNSTTSDTVTVPGTTAGNRVTGVGAGGSSVTSFSATQRWLKNLNLLTGAGNSAGGDTAAGGSINLTLTLSGADNISVVGVEVKAPIAGGGAVQTAIPGRTWRRHFKHRQFLPAQTAVAGPQNFTQPLNATLGFTGSEQMLTGKGVAATLSFTSSQARRVSKGLSATLSVAGSLATLAVHNFTQALNATLSFTSSQTRSVRTNLAGTLSFTGSQTRRVAKSISATVSFTSSQARVVRTNLAGTLSFTGSIVKRTAKNLGTATVGFTGSVGTAAVHVFTQALNATLGFTSSQSRAVRTNLAGALSFTSSQARRTAKNLAGTVSFTGSQTRRVATNLAGTVSFTSSQTRRTAKSLGTATVSFTGSLTTAAVHFFTQALNATVGFTGSLGTAAVHHFAQALNATLSFTGSLTTRRTIVKALSASLSFTSSQTKRTATTLTAGLSFVGSQTKRIAKTISATLGLTGLLDRLSSAQPRSGTASIAQMSVPDSTPGSTTAPSASAADGAVPAALRGSGTAPTSEAGNATGPTSSAP